MNLEKLTEEFFDNNLRTDKILHLPSMAADTESPCSELVDAFEWELLEFLGKHTDEEGKELEVVDDTDIYQALYDLQREGRYGF